MSADIEWATAPLLDQRNVGKSVWFSWNSNKAEPLPIVKVGRTNIHLGKYSRTHSLRVEPNGNAARGSESGFSVYACTDARRNEQALVNELITKLRRQAWGDLSTAHLAAVVDVLENWADRS